MEAIPQSKLKINVAFLLMQIFLQRKMTSGRNHRIRTLPKKMISAQTGEKHSPDSGFSIYTNRNVNIPA